MSALLVSARTAQRKAQHAAQRAQAASQFMLTPRDRTETVREQRTAAHLYARARRVYDRAVES